MTNITEVVNSFLNNDFTTRTSLFKNIISLRALSRHIIEKRKLEEKNLDAIMSAIRRYKRDNKPKDEEKGKNAFKKVNIRTKDNVVDIFLPKNRDIQQKLNKLNMLINFEKGEILRIIQAEQGIRVIIDEKNVAHFESIFTKKETISMNGKLAEVILQFFPEAVKTKGIISTVSSSLTAANINIHEMMSSAPELILIIENKDIIPALTVLNALKSL